MNIAMLIMTVLCCQLSPADRNRIEVKGMTLVWSHTQPEVRIELTAPTSGWVAVGFNDHDQLSGTYLIMARVVDACVEVREHYVIEPGVYKTFRSLNLEESVSKMVGFESDGSTKISFHLPIITQSSKAQALFAGRELHLLLAYSREDDFQHHSAMRTHLKIKL